MSNGDFESLVSGQFGPPQEWLDLGLQRTIPHIEPFSELGQRSLAIFERLSLLGDFESDQQQYILCRMYDYIDYAFEQVYGTVDEEEYTRFVAEAAEEVNEELETAADMIETEATRLAHHLAQDTPQLGWAEVDEALEDVYERVATGVEPPEVDDDAIATLGVEDVEPIEVEDMSTEHAFVEELRQLFLAEADLHFKKPRKIAAMRQTLRDRNN